METTQAVSDDWDGGVLDYQQAGPTVVRMVVGAQLRQLREARHITREDAGHVIRASHSKMSRLELGRTGLKPRDVADLLTCYGVSEEAERAILVDLAKLANTPGWWQAYSDVVPPWFEPYLGLEHAASVIRSYEVQFISGLLQTADYARAVIQLGHPGVPETELERRVGLRMHRQELLNRPQPPYLWVMLDEAVLRRPIGGAATMRAQLQHLIDITALPRVTVQVVPFSVGGHAAAGGPIAILRLPERALPDVVYLEQLTSARYPDKSADIQFYQHVLNRLVIQSASPTATTAMLHRIRSQT